MLRIQVITRDPKTDTRVVPDRTIDHDDSGQRRWLGRHCFWAFRSGYSVETVPVD